MAGWQPQQPDPRQRAPQTPPQWGQQQPDPWAGSAPPSMPPLQGMPPTAAQSGQPQWQQPQYQPPGYGPQYPPPGPPRRHQGPPKSRKGLAFLGCGGLGAIVVIIAVIAGGSSSSSSAPPAVQQPAAPAPAQPAAKAAPKPAAAQTVTYVVTGSAADVTYGPTGSDSSGTVPMKVTQKLGSPLYYAITAQLQGDGSVSCKIEVNGAVISSSTATGGYNIAQCEIGQAPLSGAWTNDN